jgi:hypothetical protein
MNRLSKIGIACAAGATAVLGLAASPSQTVSLGELIESNGTLKNDHLTFSNFSFQVACLDFNNPNATCEELFEVGHVRPISPLTIEVRPAISPGNPGLQFNDFFRVEDGYGVDFAISYQVESTKPIQSVDLNFDAVLDSGQVEIIETVSDMNGNPIGQLFADNITGNNVPDLGDSDVFDTPVTQFQVLKDINLTSVPGTGTSTMTTIEQGHAVPEPLTILGSVVALGFGVAFKKEQAKKPKT